jgi:hypothetical protein
MKSKAPQRILRALRVLGVGAVVAAAAGGANPAQAQDLGQCVRVKLDAPVVLPDGSLHQVDVLRLCLDRKMNPTAGVHEIEADGRAQLALSRIGRAEADAAAGAVVVLARNRAGELRLVGYAVPDGERMVTFTIEGIGKRRAELQAKGDLLQPTEKETEKILIAAQRSR